jgi:hypothetical protein
MLCVLPEVPTLGVFSNGGNVMSDALGHCTVEKGTQVGHPTNYFQFVVLLKRGCQRKDVNWIAEILEFSHSGEDSAMGVQEKIIFVQLSD